MQAVTGRSKDLRVEVRCDDGCNRNGTTGCTGSCCAGPGVRRIGRAHNSDPADRINVISCARSALPILGACRIVFYWLMFKRSS